MLVDIKMMIVQISYHHQSYGHHAIHNFLSSSTQNAHNRRSTSLIELITTKYCTIETINQR
jgi:hypothetical protein